MDLCIIRDVEKICSALCALATLNTETEKK